MPVRDFHISHKKSAIAHSFLLIASHLFEQIGKPSLALIFLLSFIFIPATKASANYVVWGERNIESAGYNGSESNITTPAPLIIEPHWANGLTGVSQYNGIDLEAGPTKACDTDCGLHPYVSWTDAYGNVGEVIATGTNLTADAFYTYKTSYAGNGTWRGQFCDANGCRTLGTPNLYWSQSLPYVQAGGRVDTDYTQMGPITLDTNIFLRGYTTNRYIWCYTSNYTNLPPTKVAISQCQAGIGSWQVRFPNRF